MKQSRQLDMFGPDEGASLLPLLKWAGGKQWQVPYVRPLWEPHAGRRFVEPFCGALGMTFGLKPQRALLNDMSPHPVNFYRQVRDGAGDGILAGIELTHDETTYYRNRDRFNALIRAGQAASVEAAGLTFYLNRTAFNGLFRVNQAGEFNVPIGAYKTVNFARNFALYPDPMADWEFSVGDFQDMPLDSQDFVYCDPPFDGCFDAYTASRFSWDDQQRLAHWLARHPGPVIAANSATPRIVGLYAKLGFDVRYLDAPRRVSCTGDRTPVREMLATRNS